MYRLTSSSNIQIILDYKLSHSPIANIGLYFGLNCIAKHNREGCHGRRMFRQTDFGTVGLDVDFDCNQRNAMWHCKHSFLKVRCGTIGLIWCIMEIKCTSLSFHFYSLGISLGVSALFV